MESIYIGLKQFGGLAKSFALDGTLLLWMSMVFTNQTVSSKRVTLTGNPLVIFNRDHIDAAVSSIAGNCNVSSTASFDNSNGIISVSWTYKNFIAEPLCTKAMNPTYFGYNMLTKPKLFTLSFDIRTIVTGISVNLGIIQPDQLEEIDKYRLDFVSNGRKIIARYYYDPQYAGMQPLRCVTVDGAKPFCTFRVNEVVMFPMFRHLGANLTYPEVCDCTKLTLAELSDKTHNCNVFRFVSGFLFSSGLYTDSANYANGLLNQKFGGSLSAMFLGAHQAMFIASSYGQNSPLAEELNSNASLTDAYAFCNYGGKTCSFLTFTSYDIVPTNWAVSNYYTLVQNGACADTISPSAEAWERIISVPYGPLVQNYQQCHHDAYQTLLNQAGIAVGNIQVVAPMCVIFLMLVTWLHKWWNRVPLDESYTKAEKDSALDAYAMSLLLARDERLKTHSFRGNNSIIALIAEELAEHTHLSTVSHKSHATNYSMSNLSTHSLNSLNGADSPVRSVLGKILGGTRSRSGSTSAVVVPFEDVEMMKITTDSNMRNPKTEQGSEQASRKDIESDMDEQDMSLREWIVAKKRGSLGDDGNGLDYARRGSVNAGSGHHNHPHQVQVHRAQHDRQESSNFDAALGRVMQLDANFGKGPASFAADESDKRWRG